VITLRLTEDRMRYKKSIKSDRELGRKGRGED